VAFAEVRQHDHDELAGVLGPFGHLHRGPGGGAAADAAQHALLAGQAPGHLERVLVLHLDHLVNDVHVQDARDEAGADALDLVAARLERLALLGLGDDRAGHRLDGDALEARLALLDDFADAGDGAAGADAGDQDVGLAVGVAPDLLGGGAAVDLRVGRVLEL